ncbi:hypothetical protein UFOVP418_20 [uncultured Caudovirales phage]|uniref:Uncharacterized protein n=1 Tax=uncultured Caudovirales phage TaxID=2100421 RepID=A0A6J5M5Q4_9CAUD|nr:hypothetical protein UFOVP418_20 [uncultured Caudovirales phage]
MTTAQLIHQLESWQAVHGVCKVYFQEAAGEGTEHPINGCVVAEDEDGNCDVILFNKFEGGNG